MSLQHNHIQNGANFTLLTKSQGLLQKTTIAHLGLLGPSDQAHCQKGLDLPHPGEL